MNFHVHFLDQQEAFNAAMAEVATLDELGFDTEFVGEKTFIPNLCLLQIVAGNDIYLVDTLRVTNLQPFLDLVADPRVLKITHAGDNDYRLLYTLYGTVPQNTFDTQIAAGFVGYNYPAGFARIVERELKVTLAKSHTVADWAARPLDPKAVDYAVEDVKYLPALHQRLTTKLRRRHREAWAREENRKWETPDCYVVDPNKEVLSNDFIHQLDFRQKIFLMRLYQWRREKALTLNIPKESVLQSRHISTVLRSTKDGANAFRSNRTLPEGVWKKWLPEWTDLLKTPATPEERGFIEGLPTPAPDDPELEWTMELLYHFVKKQCIQQEISAALLLPRGDFNKLKDGSDDFDRTLLSGWRAELLGPNLTDWLLKRGEMDLEWRDGSCVLKMK